MLKVNLVNLVQANSNELSATFVPIGGHLHGGKRRTRAGRTSYISPSRIRSSTSFPSTEFGAFRWGGGRQQVVLHQLVGHVLAHRPRQEAPDGLRCRGRRQARGLCQTVCKQLTNLVQIKRNHNRTCVNSLQTLQKTRFGLLAMLKVNLE